MRVLLIIVTLGILIPLQAVSQKYKNKEMSLISFNISIHENTKKYLNQYENLFPSVKNANADKIISKIKEQAWGSLVDSLQQNIGVVLLPISTFGNKISYDAYDFPDVNISKAQRIGFSKFYIKIDLEIGPEATQYPINKKEKHDVAVQLKDGEIRPVVTLTITCYPEKGIIPIGKYVGSAQTPTIWASGKPSILDGLINSNYKIDLSTLLGLINEAIFDAVINMQVK